MKQKNVTTREILEFFEKKEPRIEFKYIPEGKYYELLNRTDKKVYKVSKYKDRKIPFFSENPIVWKFHLTNNPSQDYFKNALDNYELQNDKRVEGKDRGHFVPNCFKEYLIPSVKKINNQEKLKINNFFSKGNKKNITPQDPKANRNSKDYVGQLKFEQRVQNFLNDKKNSKGEVYYEIEEYRKGALILGRRIYISLKSDSNSDEETIHVFIPEDRQNLN